jgi:cytochrome P450 PksS
MTLHADFTSQDYFRNPGAAIEKLRNQGPVVEVRFPIIGRVWTTTTQALADQVLKDTETFTIRKDDGTVAGFRWWMPGIVRMLANSMLSMDEPDHKRLRDIVDEAFRRRAVLEMEPHIQATGDALAEQLFAEGSPADLVERFARKLPLSVITELLGLPLADRPKFIAWAGGFTRFTGALGFLAMIPNVLAMKRYMERHLEIVRRQGGEGLIAEIVRVERDGGQISPNEIVAMVFLLLFAGHETTTHLISGSAHELLKNPDLRDWLEDWSRVDLAVEEFCSSSHRCSSPSRYVRKDHRTRRVRLKGRQDHCRAAASS